VRTDPAQHPLHPELRGRYRSTLALALVLLLIGLYVIGRPFARWPLKRYELLHSGVDLFAGLILTAVGCLSLRMAGFYRHCGWVLAFGPQSRRRVHLLRNPQRELFVELRRPEDPPTDEPDVRTHVIRPSWDVDSIEGTIVDVRIDENPRGPVVIETAHGPLWQEALSHRKTRWRGPKA
jgi:hypothetical protein